MTHTHAKGQGQMSARNIHVELKRTDGRTDVYGRTEAIALPPMVTQSVISL